MPDNNLYKRDLRNFNEREFEEIVINGLDWDNICDLERKYSNHSFKKFTDAVNFHLDEMAPYKKVTKKEFKLMTKPWISKEILNKCRQRDSILKSITMENDAQKIISIKNDYKKLRNEITKIKRDSKKAYYIAYFERNKQKSANIWKGIKSLVNIKAGKFSNIKLLDKNNNMVSDNKKISNMFNDHFSTVGNKIKEKFPSKMVISEVT